MQIYADVLKRPIKIAAEENASAFGAAMHASVAAGIYPNLTAAAKKMTRPPTRVFKPRKEASGVYDQLYREYLRLHDYFGRNQAGTMKTLGELARKGMGV
jgi:L-ribulokinase